ncbi:unnamed protein product [Discula destructiva]
MPHENTSSIASSKSGVSDIALLQTPHSSSSSSDHGQETDAAQSIPGLAEKPLEEQLEPIAVIGMGCRLPGNVKSPSEFWDLMMRKGTGNNPKVPSNRFNIDAHFHKNNDRPGSFNVPGGYFLHDDLAEFDPGLFGITPVEAMWMDPQQRKLLEVVYEALESAGVPLERISGTRTAVFAASFTADWQQMAFKEPSFRHSLAATGVDTGILSNRISHVFNLHGPSIVCNTACSSSVYALHNACNALRNCEAEGAIVGGVNLIITVDQHMNTAKLGVLSPTSTCHTFDETADGYGRADAVGAVYLKRLSDAIRDGDPIRGVIRSSATNSNGKVNGVGITFPSCDGQADVIAAAYERGGNLDPRLTGYFECHGTGTPVGDPIEVKALAMAMNQNRRHNLDQPLWIGAVKTNIGHSEAASGISALIKAIMIAERGVIPPTRGVTNLNRAIKWDEWQVRVPTEAQLFPSELPVRRISLNSFGYGGTNAHIIVEASESISGESPATYTYVDSWRRSSRAKLPGSRRASERKRPYLLLFSAHDRATLVQNIDAHGKVAANYTLLDLAYTLANRRSALLSKAFTTASYSNLSNVFANVKDNFVFAEKKKVRSVGFIFTGQGAQWARMGAELMEYCPQFLNSIRTLDLALENLHDGPEWCIEDVLFERADTSRINEAEFSQPLCTAVQIALVQMLQSWGVRPVVVVGHSSGEIAAGYTAGLVSAEDAIIGAYYRGIVARNVMRDGSMLAVGLGNHAMQQYLADLQGKVVIACDNSPELVTLSGDREAIVTVQARLRADVIFHCAVKTSGKAYHSHHMSNAATELVDLIRESKRRSQIQSPRLDTTARMVSSTTGKILEEIDDQYWSRNLQSPVLFNQAMQTALTEESFSEVDLLIEVGPHSALSGPIKQIRRKLEGSSDKIEYIPTLIRHEDSSVRLLKVAGELFLRNYKALRKERVTSAYFDDKQTSNTGTEDHGRSKGSVIVDLPPYQWNYARQLWAESRSSREQRQLSFPRHDLLGQRIAGGSLSEPSWRNVLRIRDLPWLKDHSLGGEPVFPAAGYFAMAIEAVRQVHELGDAPEPIENYSIRDVGIQTALVTPDDDDGIEVLFNMRPSVHGDHLWDWRVSSIDVTSVKKDHMQGKIGINTRPRGKRPREVPAFLQRASGKAWNAALREVGFDYGKKFQDMDNVRFDGKKYHASCSTNIKQVVDESLGESRYVLHPACIDSTLQLCIASIYAGRTEAMECGVVPVAIGDITIWPPTEEQVRNQKAFAYANTHRRGNRVTESNLQMVSAQNGELVLEMTNIRTIAYEAAICPKAGNRLDVAPYGTIAWDLDFGTDDNWTGIATHELVNMALFKCPGSRVVELGFRHAPSILSVNPNTSYTIVITSRSELESAQAVIAGRPTAAVIFVNLEQDLEQQGLKNKSYDMVIADSNAKEKPLLDVHCLRKNQPMRISSDFTVAFRTPLVLPESNTKSVSVQLVYRENHSPLLFQIKDALLGLGWDITMTRLLDLTSSKVSQYVIMFVDVEVPLLFSLRESEFLAVQNIICHASSLLWVTDEGCIRGERPEHAMVRGLARACAAERASLDFRVLDIELGGIDPSAIVRSVIRISRLQIDMTEETPEREFAVSGGKTYISRIVPAEDLNRLYSARNKPQSRIFSPGDRIAGVVAKSKLVFRQLDKEAAVKHEHVEVLVQASNLTKDSARVITGSDYATTPSFEIGGVITRVGPGVSSFKTGDKVVGFHAGHFESYQQVPATMIHKIKEQEDISKTVTALAAYAAAIHGLERLARVRSGDNVLVMNDTGAAGIAAIITARQFSSNVFAVVSSDAEATFLQVHLQLEADHVIRAWDGPISERLEHLTGGHGADVVFSAGGSVGQSAAHEAWRCIAAGGRYLDTGRKGELGSKVIDAAPIHRGASYISFDILEILLSRPHVLAQILPTVVSQASKASLGMTQTLQLGEINGAVSGFSDTFDATSFVVDYQAPEASIEVLPSAISKPEFHPNATYLLVGCLGGLGRSLVSWMLECGARRFTFLSRSGADTTSASHLVRHIESEGAFVQIVRGDVASKHDVMRAVRGIPAGHPLKGVVHAAMVLRDGLFHAMTYKQWKESTEPKVFGAHNLHSVLADADLDFFIMTSSVSGILGMPGQSNYAAANAYLDSLARHRRTTGKAATSIILPMVLGVGVVAESDTLEEALKRKGMYGIDEEHLLQSFAAAILADSHLASVPDHVIVGLDPAKMQKSVKDSASTDALWLGDARFTGTLHSISLSKSTSDTRAGIQHGILISVRAAASQDEAIALISDHVVNKLARMLMVDRQDIDPEVGSIASYGIDSMVGAELRNWIFKDFAIDMPFQQLLSPTLTIRNFAKQVHATQNDMRA